MERDGWFLSSKRANRIDDIWRAEASLLTGGMKSLDNTYAGNARHRAEGFPAKAWEKRSPYKGYSCALSLAWRSNPAAQQAQGFTTPAEGNLSVQSICAFKIPPASLLQLGGM